MKEWIDGHSTVDAKSLNDIEKAIENLEINKISLPAGGSDGYVLIKNGSTVNWSNTIGDISAINSKFYSILNINKFLNGSSTSTPYSNLDNQLQTTSKYLVPAINENFNNLIDHINSTNVHGINSIRDQLQNNIDLVQLNVDAINLQLSDIDESINDINDQIAILNSKIGSQSGNGNKIGLEDYKQKLFSLIQTGQEMNKAGDNSVVFGDGNDTSNSKYSITAGYHIKSNAGNDYLSIFGQELISDSSNELLVGKFNAPVIDGKFVIGDGTNTNRKNLLQLDKNGNFKILDVLDLTDGNLNIKNSLSTKNITVDKITINNELILNELKLTNLTVDDLLVNNNIIANNLNLNNDITAKNLILSEKITSNNIENSEKIITDSLETKLIAVTNGTNTTQIEPDSILVDNLIVNKDTKLNGNVSIIIDINTPTNKFSVSGPSEFNSVKTGDLTSSSITCSNSVSISSNLKVSGRILDSEGNSGEVGQVLTSDGMNNFKWAAPEFTIPEVLMNLKDYGRLYGIVQKSDTSKPNTSGYYSIVFGQNNDREKANYSITSGLDNKSNNVHNFTQLFGEGLISDNSSEMLIGAYNKPVTNGAFIVGNGTDNLNRTNLFELDKYGSLIINNNDNNNIFKLDKNSNLTINKKFTAESIDVKNLTVQNGIDLTGVSLSFEDLNVKNLTVENKTLLKGEVELRNNLVSTANIESNTLNVDSKITSASLDTTLINNTGVLNTVGVINNGNEEIAGSLSVTGEISNTDNIKSTGDLTIKNISSNDINANNITAKSLKTEIILDSTGTLDAKAGYILTVNTDNKTISWKPNAAVGIGVQNLLDYGTGFGLVQKSTNGNSSGKNSVVFGDSNSRSSANFSITSGSENSSITGHNYTNIFGKGLLSDNAYETLIGKYNKPVIDGAFVIGNGIDNSDRKNLFEFNKDGSLIINNSSNSNIFKLDKDSNLTINKKFTSESIDVGNLKVKNGIDLTGISLSFEDLNIKNLTVENKTILNGITELKNDLTSTADITAENLNVNLKITSDSLDTTLINNTGALNTVGIINSGDENITGKLTISGEISSTNNIKSTGNLKINNIESNDINANNITAKSLKIETILDSTGTLDTKAGYILTINNDNKTVSWKPNSGGSNVIQNLLDYGTNFGLVQKSTNGNSSGKNSVVFGDSNSRSSANFSITSGSENSSLAGHDYTNIFGKGLLSDNAYETLIGKYNKSVINGAFVIGNGTDNSNRKNLLELDKSGAIIINNDSTNIFKLDKDSNLTINKKFTSESIDVENLKIKNGIDLTGISLSFEDLNIKNLTVENKTILKGITELKNDLTSTADINVKNLNANLKITSDSLDTTLINNTGVLNTVGIINNGNEEIIGKLTISGEISSTNNIKSTGNLKINNIESNDIKGNNIDAKSLKIETILDSTGTLDTKAGYILTVNNDNKTVSWKPNSGGSNVIQNLLDYGTDFGLVQKSTNGNSSGKNSVVFGDSNSRSSANFSITSGSENSSSTGHDYTNIFGKGLLSDNAYETLIGKYNKPIANGAFIIGNGTSTIKSNLMSLDFSGNLNINNKLTLTSGKLSVSDEIESKKGTFADLIVTNSIEFTGTNFELDEITIKKLLVTEELNVSAGNVSFLSDVTIGQNLIVQNVNASGAIQSSTIKTTGSISADGNISSKNNIISEGNISGLIGRFTNSLSTNGNFEASEVKSSSLIVNGNASADIISCTSIATKSIIDSNNSSGSSGNVLSISDDGSKIVWKSLNSDGTSKLQNLLDYGPAANYSLVQKTPGSSTNNSAGVSSVVFGSSNIRDKSSYSITSGRENYTAAAHSFTEVFGEQIVTDDSYEMILGKYNNAVTNGAFVIGIGENDSNRKNLLELNKSGQLKINNGNTNLLTLDASGNLSIANRVSGGIATFETLTVTNGIEFGGDQITFRDLELDTLVVKTSAGFECDSVNINNNALINGTLTSNTGNFTNLNGNILTGVTCNLTTINSENITNSNIISTKTLNISENLSVTGDISCGNTITSNTINFTSGKVEEDFSVKTLKIDQLKDHSNSLGGENYFLSSDGQYVKWVQINSSGSGSGGSGTDYSADITNLYSYIGNMQDLKSDSSLDLVSAINEVYDKAFASSTDPSSGSGVGKYYPDNDNPTNESGVIFNDYLNNSAGGKYSATFGYQTKAMGDYQFSCGKQNIFDASALFTVGNGSGENYSNAMVVTESGDIKIQGIIKNGTGGCNNGDVLTAVDNAGKLELKWDSVDNITGIDDVKNRLTTLETNTGNVGTIASDVQDLKTNYTTLEGKVTTNENNITTLQSDLGTAQSNIETNTNSISDLETLIGDLNSSSTVDKASVISIINELYGMITALQTRVETLENGGTPPSP